MSEADLINGVFESVGGFFIWLNIVKLHKQKMVRGVSWMHVAFFSAWGIWNLYYYPALAQWLSFFGGLFLVISNLIWLAQIAHYLMIERRKNVAA
jgi:hypothetical protein